MEHNMLTLDFWQDTVTYEGNSMPTGTMGCEALNIPDTILAQLNTLCEPLTRFVAAMGSNSYDAPQLEQAGKTAVQILELLQNVPPFSRLDTEFYKSGILNAFTPEGLQNLQEYILAMMMGTFSPEQTEQYREGILIARLTPVLANLSYSLRDYQETMRSFAETMDVDSADRSLDGLAKLFGENFPPEFTLSSGASWMSLTNITVQYLSTIRPGCDTPMLVKRMHYVSFVGMLRSDLFEGLCVGHAPKKCPICGKWFLTTNARHTKYCGDPAPGDRLHRTCRQIGNLRGREQRELAADHPLKQIYERRLNTINRYVKRGTLDAETAKRMKKLAKDKMLRAISDVSYAKGCYEQEMEQDALLTAVTAKK
ncbi:MAG: DUF6076 domain-containing protein [Clostridiales bacterium]|nr:DUF6076 domain-containing protein [Clostridiales bacterium]